MIGQVRIATTMSMGLYGYTSVVCQEDVENGLIGYTMVNNSRNHKRVGQWYLAAGNACGGVLLDLINRGIVEPDAVTELTIVRAQLGQCIIRFHEDMVIDTTSMVMSLKVSHPGLFFDPWSDEWQAFRQMAREYGVNVSGHMRRMLYHEVCVFVAYFTREVVRNLFGQYTAPIPALAEIFTKGVWHSVYDYYATLMFMLVSTRRTLILRQSVNTRNDQSRLEVTRFILKKLDVLTTLHRKGGVGKTFAAVEKPYTYMSDEVDVMRRNIHRDIIKLLNASNEYLNYQ